MKKACQYIIIAVFLIIIVLPLILINRDKDAVSLLENKKLAEKPSLLLEDSSININYIEDLQSYINDNIGLKQQAIVFNIAYKYKFFRKVDIPYYIKGKDGHVFYTNTDTLLTTMLGKDMLSEDRLKDITKNTKRMQAVANSFGADFYIVTIPDKQEVYPEYLPDSINNVVDKTKLDILDEYINENSDIRLLNLKPMLLKEKEKTEELSYYKNYDATHWNQWGAFLGYRGIMNFIQKYDHDISAVPVTDYDVVKTKTPSTIAHLSGEKMLCDAFEFEDYMYSFQKKSPTDIMIETTPPKEIKVTLGKQYFHYNNPAASSHKTLLILGDSYIYSFMLPFLSESFENIYYQDYSIDPEIFYELGVEVKPDIVLFEFVHRMNGYDSTQKYSLFSID